MNAGYQDYQRQRTMGIGDLLLDNRIVFLQGEINNLSANDLVMKLLYLQSVNRRKEIHFYINSPGGSVSSMLAIYDTMKYSPCDIATYGMGLAASMGQFLLSGGTKGKRYALPHARIMMHQPSAGVGGTAADIAIQAEQFAQTKREMAELIAEHTGQTFEQITKDSDRDRWFTAQEAKEYGLVDHVISHAEGPISN